MFKDYLDLQMLEATRSSASAAWEAVSWTKTASISSIFSAVVSFVTFCAAIYAMNTWRSQEKVSAKREIKKAASKFFVELELMPEKFSKSNVNGGFICSRSENIETHARFKDKINEWAMHEKISELYLSLKYLGHAIEDDLNEKQKALLKEIDQSYKGYYTYEESKTLLEQALKQLLEELEIYKK